MCAGSEVWHPMCKEAARLERKLRVSDTQNTHNPLSFLSISVSVLSIYFMAGTRNVFFKSLVALFGRTYPKSLIKSLTFLCFKKSYLFEILIRATLLAARAQSYRSMKMQITQHGLITSGQRRKLVLCA